MHFLITNDDGYDSPGILALEQALLPLGRVTVVAPKLPLSGCSHQVTTDRAISIEMHKKCHYSIGGMPSDCVRLGLLHLATDCDWVVSGINEGANLGCDLYYSGTVAAAREAVLIGRPAMAVSHYHTSPHSIDWKRATMHTRRVMEQLLAEPLAAHTLWNINLPAPDRLHEQTPVHRCPIDANRLDIAYQFNEQHANYCHGRYHDRRRTPGTDVDICFGGGITISEVPLYHPPELV